MWLDMDFLSVECNELDRKQAPIVVNMCMSYVAISVLSGAVARFKHFGGRLSLVMLECRV